MAAEESRMNKAAIQTEPEMSGVTAGAVEPGGVAATGADGSEEIRQEIERTRSRMDGTIDELSERFSPRHILDDLIDIWQGTEERGRGARRTFKETGARLVESVQAHPLPATLIGAGLAWLLLEEKRPQRRLRMDDAGPSTYGGPIDDSLAAGETHGETGAADRIREKTDRLGSELRSGYEAGSRSLHRWLDEAPLAAGAAALAAGLAAGLMLPGTAQEDELMGEASDSLKDQVRLSGAALTDEAVRLAEEAAGSDDVPPQPSPQPLRGLDVEG